VDVVRRRYAGRSNPRTGDQIFPGLEPGSELGWNELQVILNPPAGSQRRGYPGDHFKYLVFKNPNWDYRTFNYDTDVALADKLDNNTINAIDPNLKQFVGHGGKLFLYHGWNDPILAPRNTALGDWWRG
jgi:feruloyl esterase